MSWRVHPHEFLARHKTTADTPTTPERPETIDAQMSQLSAGLRRVVMIPRGTKMPSKIPKHLKTIREPKVGNFIFHPGKIGPKQIRHAVRKNHLPEILGAADGGMGAPDKSELSDPVSAVIGKDASGTTVQGTLSDGANLPLAIAQTEKVTPADGSVGLTSPAEEIADRQGWALSPEDFLQRAATAA